MLLRIHEKENKHYYVVMGWLDKKKQNAPRYKKRFDIYDSAVDYFRDLLKKCKFVQIFENIGGKRKWIADSENTENL